MCPPLGDRPTPLHGKPAGRPVLGAPPLKVLLVRKAIILFCLSVPFIPASAFPRDPLEPDSDGDTLSEIIVTARKVEENVQDIPMSVQVLSADFLDDAGVTRLYELQFSIPGLVVSNAGMFGARFALRGVADQGGTGLSVATHLNGVYLGDSNLSIARMFDLERVEVLKGPQGTLYGRNATGGSINFITAAPEEELSAKIEGSYGSFDTARLEGYVNLPFDRADFRVAFIGSEGEGYIRNSVDDRRFAEEDFWGLRGSLRAHLTENLHLDLTVQRVRDDGASGELWTPQPAFLPDPRDIRLTTVTLANPFLKTENDYIGLNVEYDLGFASLHSVTGYARNEVRNLDDCAGIPLLQGCVRGVRPARYDQWSQELRFAARAGASVDWLIGAYLFDADESTNFHFSRPLLNQQPINDSTSTSDETAYAAFGQVTLHLTDRWSITGGLRLSAEEHRVSDIGTGTDDHPTLTTADNDWNRSSWRFDLEYTIGGALVYGGVSTGFKSGGITTTVLPSGDFNNYDAEDLIAWEAGFKSQWLDRRLTLNGAAFLYDFRGLQINSVYIFNDRAISEVENAAKAEIYGIDAVGTFRISDRLTASGSVVWLPKREFVEFQSERRDETLSGNKLSRAPESIATASLDYEISFGGRGRLSGRLEYNYRSSFFFTADNDRLLRQEGFGLLNAFLKFELPTEKWYVLASGRNLAAEDYFNQIFLQSSPGYSDTYEVGVGYYF
jgi:iron complex outermembrane receptor protein